MNFSCESLSRLRQNLYQEHIKRRSAATLNLLDANCSMGKWSNSVVELSRSKFFARNYCSIHRAISEGAASIKWKNALSEVPVDNEASFPFSRFVLDATPVARSCSCTLKDCSIVYSPNQAPGNKPIALGHQYSVVVELPGSFGKERKHWVLPRSCERISSNENGSKKGMKQIQEVIQSSNQKQQRYLTIGDSSYGSKSCLSETESSHQLHLFRIRNNRVLFEIQKDCEGKKKQGGQQHYGKKMKLSVQASHLEETASMEFSLEKRDGSKAIIKAKSWSNLAYKSSKKDSFTGYEKEILLMSFELFSN